MQFNVSCTSQRYVVRLQSKNGNIKHTFPQTTIPNLDPRPSVRLLVDDPLRIVHRTLLLLEQWPFQQPVGFND